MVWRFHSLSDNYFSLSATIEAEAARYVQYYFRKWKMRTLFQQLQIYRADKQQHLVYFSQQVRTCCLLVVVGENICPLGKWEHLISLFQVKENMVLEPAVISKQEKQLEYRLPPVVTL